MLSTNCHFFIYDAQGCKSGVPHVLSVDPQNLLQSNEQTIAPDQTQHPSHDLVERNQQLMTSSDVGTYSLEQSISGKHNLYRHLFLYHSRIVGEDKKKEAN